MLSREKIRRTYYNGYILWQVSLFQFRFQQIAQLISAYIHHKVNLSKRKAFFRFSTFILIKCDEWLIKRHFRANSKKSLILFMVNANVFLWNLKTRSQWNPCNFEWHFVFTAHAVIAGMPNAIWWKMIFRFHVSIVALFFFSCRQKANMVHPAIIVLFVVKHPMHDWKFFQQHSMTDCCQIELWMLPFFCFILTSAFQNSDACHVNYMFAFETEFHMLPVPMKPEQNVPKPFISLTHDDEILLSQ